MPELVEVETTRRDLSKIITGEKIYDVKVLLDKIVYNKKEEFINKLINNAVLSVKRRGKWLLFELNDDYLIIHFRMEGRFYLKQKDDVIDKHDYVIFYFKDFSLHYNDPRLFGKMEVVKKHQIEEFFKQKNLGLEYDDMRLTKKYLKEKLKCKKNNIKSALLDQSIITGIGNIYADEILFESNVHPKSICNKLSLVKLQAIIDNTKRVFENALSYKGTYPNIDGTRGSFENYLMVHLRKNKPCYKCNNLIIKEQIGGRGTYFCSSCQKLYK